MAVLERAVAETQLLPTRQMVGRYRCGTVPVGWHFQIIDPLVPVATGENTSVLPSILALARRGEALEKVAVITPLATVIFWTNFPDMDVSAGKPADALLAGVWPVLDK